MRRVLAVLLCIGAVMSLRFSTPAPVGLAPRAGRALFLVEADLSAAGAARHAPSRPVVEGERVWLAEGDRELSFVLRRASGGSLRLHLASRDRLGRETFLEVERPLAGSWSAPGDGGGRLLAAAGLEGLTLRHRPYPCR